MLQRPSVSDSGLWVVRPSVRPSDFSSVRPVYQFRYHEKFQFNQLYSDNTGQACSS